VGAPRALGRAHVSHAGLKLPLPRGQYAESVDPRLFASRRYLLNLDEAELIAEVAPGETIQAQAPADFAFT